MRCFKLLGWMLLLPVLVSCSSQKARSQLLGYWEGTETKEASVEFLADGSVVFGGSADVLFDSKVIKMLRDFNMKPARNSMTFTVLDKEHVEIQGEFTSLLEKLSAGGKASAPEANVAEFRPRETLAFTVSGDELTLSAVNGKSMKFRRSS